MKRYSIEISLVNGDSKFVTLETYSFKYFLKCLVTDAFFEYEKNNYLFTDKIVNVKLLSYDEIL